jgi:hypothetical protein
LRGESDGHVLVNNLPQSGFFGLDFRNAVRDDPLGKIFGREDKIGPEGLVHVKDYVFPKPEGNPEVSTMIS